MRAALEYVIENLQKNKISAKVVIETPAGQGTELLTDLNEVLIFYNSFTEEQKKYLGICLDTAHIWAAGYELSDAHKMISNKNAEDLVAIHLNNSKVIKGSSVDRHATLFDNTGTIPYNSIKQYLELLRDKKKATKHLPIIILETPSTKYADELLWIANIF
jgi:deoxyribonuclease-4